ncbi:hypothetical protein [Holospora curviuscula]|uniref:Uncharacterized protein n=1 Tax=Holospora curviuscula TaxID=1082868 RepID=A0A2S5RA51_9PROT|nr:hypothetical protein [Holospora curviuscula]PPE04177.1 hypothetical protein HCUR_00368 [Holospora curviuscula]
MLSKNLFLYLFLMLWGGISVPSIATSLETLEWHIKRLAKDPITTPPENGLNLLKKIKKELHKYRNILQDKKGTSLSNKDKTRLEFIESVIPSLEDFLNTKYTLQRAEQSITLPKLDTALLPKSELRKKDKVKMYLQKINPFLQKPPPFS